MILIILRALSSPGQWIVASLLFLTLAFGVFYYAAFLRCVYLKEELNQFVASMVYAVLLTPMPGDSSHVQATIVAHPQILNTVLLVP